MQGLSQLLNNRKTECKAPKYRWQESILEIIKFLDLPKPLQGLLWALKKRRGEQAIYSLLAEIQQGEHNFKSDLAKEKYLKMLLKNEV